MCVYAAIVWYVSFGWLLLCWVRIMDFHPENWTASESSFSTTYIVSWRHGMTIVAGNDPRIMTVEVTEDLITAQLADGRIISIPLAWSWRLSNATPEQRQHFEIIGTGQGVHWPDIDEDISALGMLTGTPALPPKQKA
jgi:hypothetical protein